LRTCKTSRCLSVLGFVTFTLFSLVGCGGGGASSGTIVAQVAGVGAISEATLKHWMSVEAVVFYQEYPTGPVPKGVLPDPPNYTACIAFLKSTPSKLAESGPKPTAAQLESQCMQELHKIKELTLNMLIGWDWTLAQGKALGFTATNAELDQRYVQVNAKLFPQKGEFARYLERTGQTHADMLLRAKVQLFEVKQSQAVAAAEKRVPPKLTSLQLESAIIKLMPGLQLPAQLVAKTSCSKGFVTADCKQYKTSAASG
jgi:foldase protein PrsA